MSPAPAAIADSGAGPAMDRLSWQATLFAQQPKRRALTALMPSWPLRPLRCRVTRNHSFELVAPVLTPYLQFAGFEPSFIYSDYDDALNFDLAGEADIDILWLDLSRYDSDVDLGAWLRDRLVHLRDLTPAPILLIHTGYDGTLDLGPPLPSVYTTSLSDVQQALGPGFLDQRASQHSGTNLSNAACIETARLMGSHWIPAIFRPATKALVLDLDNTLYQGVLGEDRPDGVKLTEGHRALQQLLKEWKDRGVFLALASRNREEDVRMLFECRTDFPLSWSDFSHHGISWDAKAETIRATAKALRIGTDAMLFIDDNPGELLAVKADLPDIGLLHAGADGAETAFTLMHFPGLFQWRESEEDAQRVADLATTSEREVLAAKAASAQDYLASLGVELRFRQDDPGSLFRAAQLAGKTNQFNLALARSNETHVASYIEDDDKSLVTVSLKDRLSDSGVIAMLLGRRDGDALIIDELCISCRALGRGVESLVIVTACRLMEAKLDTQTLAFQYSRGLRNAPALDWLECLTGDALAADADTVQLSAIPRIEMPGVTLLGVDRLGETDERQ